MEFLIIIAVFGLMMWFMQRSAKKQQQQRDAERDSALVVGTDVRTIGGFFGTVVDVDGDAVTLESPSGVETVWMKNAIVGPATLNLASGAEDDSFEETLAASESIDDGVSDPTVSTLDDPNEKNDPTN